MSASLGPEGLDLLAGYWDLPFLAKPITYPALYHTLAPLLRPTSRRPWRTSGSWRRRSAATA